MSIYGDVVRVYYKTVTFSLMEVLSRYDRWDYVPIGEGALEASRRGYRCLAAVHVAD